MINDLQSMLGQFGQQIVSLLPLSPFRSFIETWEPPAGVRVLAWFVPIGAILDILAMWLVAISSFYLISVLLRWLKVIGD